MSDNEIIAQVRKRNSDDDNSESDEYEVIETFKTSNSDVCQECFAKGLMWLEQQTDSDSTELMLLKQLRDRANERRQSCLRQSKLPFISQCKVCVVYHINMTSV
ncbi:hypothetical protein AVEN_29364-1 [Araneus ventricosus]|uniref:Uncharacterized protein n=1 Tax=Araneus ventricosus TaxID=182803 RepID=A0A4Y2WG50_ARAVE|nr:hypothetical protein AVEN_29364-1 [Araneus ventricosus]